MLKKSHFNLKKEFLFAFFAIPVVSLLILLYNLNEFENDFDRPLWVSYIVGTFFTGHIWVVNLLVFKWVNEKYYGIHETQKRIIFQMIASTIVTFLAYVTNVLLLTYALNMPCTWEIFVKDLKVTYLVTLMVTIYYHSAYYFKQWKLAYIDMEKLRKESVLAQYETLKNQVNPHFLFNSLNKLSELVNSDASKA
ncbi:MAG: histidine kinase [Cytophagales bacterium]